MFKFNLMRLVIFAGIVLACVNVKAQEFPVAVGADTTFSGGAAYGGENYIVAVQGDSSSQYSINAQIVDTGGELIGPRISLGADGIFPGATPIFDGTNYFLIWREFNGDLKGQFIDTSGALVGSSLTIATNVSVQYSGSSGIALADTLFLVIFTKTDNILYGQFVSFSGSLIGGQIQISTNHARESSMAYDGTNFLVTWVEKIPDIDKDIYGQFVSKAGSLVGNNFLIDGGPNYSDNPISIAFDGTRYLLVYHDQPPTGGNWFIMGCFINTSGVIENTLTICDSSLAPFIAFVAFDNENYFITWTQLNDMSMWGRFYNTSGVPIDTSFVVMSPSENKFPVGGVWFGGGLYLVVGTKVDSNLSDGDVYARFISPLPSGVDNETNLTPDNITLYQNYPNPFNPVTEIKFALKNEAKTYLNIYNMKGEKVKTLINGDYIGKDRVITKVWNGTNQNNKKVSSGIYLYKLNAGKYSSMKRMLLLK